MISSSHRISTALFKEVIQKGEIFHSPYFVARIQKSQESSRFAVSISKKNAKTAVLRNKVKRRVYSAISGFIPKVNTGFNTIFLMKAGTDKIKLSLIKDEVNKVFVKSGVLK